MPKKTHAFWRDLIWSVLSLSMLLFLIVGTLYAYLESELPDVKTLKHVEFQTPLKIYTSDQLLIATYGEKRRIPISYHEIPKQMIAATLATEDQRFFEHPGVDFRGLLRASFQLIKTGNKSQGGSTITMQVARNFFLTRKKTFLRKFNEILLAMKIDRELSKEKVLELYLNKIYFGSRAYGVAAAAEVYYGKKLSELTLPEVAMIAGLPQSPSAHNPIANPKAAKARRNHVLRRMYEEQMINETDYKHAIKIPLTEKYHGTPINVEAPYVAEMIRQALYKNFGEAAYTKGYKIYTTIDSRLQKVANWALEKNLLSYDKRHGYRGPLAHLGPVDIGSLPQFLKKLKDYPTVHQLQPALIVDLAPQSATAILKEGKTIEIAWPGLLWARRPLNHGEYLGPPLKSTRDILKTGDVVYVEPLTDSTFGLSELPDPDAAIVVLSPKDGAIRALSGGFDFYKSNYNRAAQANRQPGSSFKPFLYAAALAKGFTLATVINDAPIVIDDPSQARLWRPQNDTRKFYGPTRLRVALIESRNLVSIRLLRAIGVNYAVHYVENFGFNSQKIPKNLSLALGTLSTTPLDLARAYAVFANGGYKIEPYLIQTITDPRNHILLKARPKIACLNCKTMHTLVAAPHPSSQEVPQEAPQVITPQVAYLMTSVLQDVIARGSGRDALVLKRSDLGGKTGTTQDQRDAWFAGFNTELVTITWMGFDHNQSLYEYGREAALPMWIDFMREALKGTLEHTLSVPPDIVSLKINPKTGNLAYGNDPQAIYELFMKHTAPTYYTTPTTQPSDTSAADINHLF